MARFTKEEQRDMIQIYYANNRNSRNTAQSYFEQYPERNQPNETYFLKLHRKLGEFGQFNAKRLKYGTRLPLENRDAIIQSVRQMLKEGNYLFCFQFSNLF